MRIKILALIAVFSMVSSIGFAQVTSSSITGTVKGDDNKFLEGASVVAVHQPSGTKYSTTTTKEGSFTILNVRVGGPYVVTVSFVGFKAYAEQNVYAPLGNTANVDVTLTNIAQQMESVVVTARPNPILNSKANGASVTIGRQILNATPTIGRSVNDITKYNAYSNGRSFAGQDSRFNNFTIDGSVFNNGFGLGSDAQAGGRTGSAAISLDALEELQINISPYDIKQSGFAGASINAVTRSGTNEFAGSVFRFWNSRDLAGTKAASAVDNVPNTPFNVETNGFRVGGPIIKNKLFFFVNGEFTKGAKPALDWVANRAGATGNVSRTTAADLEDLKSFMSTNFNWDMGAIDNFNNESFSKKVLARIDYNINDIHKLTIRYANHNSQSDVTISNSNSGTTAGNGNRQNLALAISGQNTGYIILDNTRSAVLELNSNFKNRVSNQFLITYNKQIEDRKYRTDLFPTVDILNSGSTYTTIGFDPFTPSNKLNYATFNATNNTTLIRGKHTITLGAAFESFKSNNLFFYGSNGVWVFNSIADFKTAALAYKANPNQTTSPVPIARFNYRYTLLPDGKEPWQTFQNQFYTLYAQDEYKATKNFRLSYGVRVDYLNIPNTASDYYNPYVSSLSFRKTDGSPYAINTGEMPSSKLYVSPRLGFNWDVFGNRNTQVRGGSGLFLSRLPYVLISNQLGNNGVNIGLINATGTAALAYPFTLNPKVYTPTNTNIADLRGYNLNYGEPKLNFPQIWKSNIAVDQRLPFGGLIGTVEFIYNKNINMLHYYDANMIRPASYFAAGDDKRLYYPALDLSGASASNARFVNPGLGNAFVLANNGEGYSYSLTTKIEKPVSKNWGGTLAYTYAKAKDLSSVASTVNASTPAINGMNYLDVAYSDNDLRHRVMGFINYKLNYGKSWGGATTISLGMISASGFKLSYTYSNDQNGDGQINDLIYIPAAGRNLTFQDYTLGASTYTAAMQAEAFNNYVDKNPYLSKRRGQYAERNGAEVPWLTRFDFSVEQDFFVRTGKDHKANTLRFRVDILNGSNLLNNKWGVGNVSTTPQPLNYRGRTATGEPIYRLATQVINAQTVLLSDSYIKSKTLSDVYQIQMGLRYIFNN